MGMAVVGDELFVGDYVHRCLHVFSMAGAHLREVRGVFGRPLELLHHNSRLYLFEELEDGADPASGRRILVLAPQGQTLQVWRTPGEAVVFSACLFGRKLLVKLNSTESEPVKLLALKGI